MALQIDTHLPNGVLQHLQNMKDFVSGSVNSLTNSAQQVGESFKATATQTTDKAIDTVTTTLEQSLQTAEQIKSTTSGAVKTAVASSVNDWLTQHPIFFKLVQILGWATNHPIISLIILIFALAFIWSIIKAIIGLIETVSWSILRVPLKLIQGFIKVSFVSLTKLGSFAVQQITGAKTTDNIATLLPATSETIYQEKQQRLAEISNRLEAIQKEQHELLQEAADLIAADTIDMKISEIKPLKTFESHLG